MKTPRYTVEPIQHKGYGIGTHAIRYTPPTEHKPDGSKVIGLSFHCLIASDMLADAENGLGKVAEVLNGSEIGR